MILFSRADDEGGSPASVVGIVTVVCWRWLPLRSFFDRSGRAPGTWRFHAEEHGTDEPEGRKDWWIRPSENYEIRRVFFGQNSNRIDDTHGSQMRTTFAVRYAAADPPAHFAGRA